MPARYGIDAIMLFCETDSACAAIQISADGDDPRDACCLGAFENLRKVRLEFRII